MKVGHTARCNNCCAQKSYLTHFQLCVSHVNSALCKLYEVSRASLNTLISFIFELNQEATIRMNGFIQLFVFVAALFQVFGGERNVNFCEVSPCLRKCCPEGHFLANRTCEVTEMDLDFSDLGVDRDAPIQHEVVKCDESQSRFLLDSTDEFYVEENNLVWPLLNLTVSHAFYCIDMIDDFAAPKALMCYGGAPEESKVHFCSGK